MEKLARTVLALCIDGAFDLPPPKTHTHTYRDEWYMTKAINVLCMCMHVT